MALEIFRLVGSVFVDTDEANKSLKKTDEKAEGFGKTLLDGITTVAKWGAAVAAGAAAAGTALLAVATNAASAMDAIDKGSAKVGISKTAYQEWSYVLGQNGMDIGKLEVGMKTLVAAMDGAASGTESAAEKFDALGLSIYDSNGKLKDQETMLKEALFALADMENGTEKARLATELFGKAGVDMMPMLNGGSEGIADLAQRAHELGLVMSDEAVTAGVVLGDTMDDVKQSFGALATKLGVTLMPTIQKVLDLILENLPVVQEMFEKTGQIAVEAYSILKSQIETVVQGFKDACAWIAEHEALVKLAAIAIGTLTAAIIAYNAAQAIKKAGGIVEIAQLAAIQVGLWGLTAAETAHTAAATIGTTVTTAFGAAINFLTSPITLVVLAIGALIAIIYLLVENWDTVKAAAISCWEWIKEAWSPVGEWFDQNVVQPLAALIAEIAGTFQMAWDVIKLVWDYVEPYFTAIWENIKIGVSILWTMLTTGFQNAWEIIKLVWAVVSSYFTTIWENIKVVFSVVETYLGGMFRTAWETIKAIWDVVIAYFTLVWAGIKAVFAVVKGVLSGDFSDAWDAIKNVWDKAKDFFSSILNGIKIVFGSTTKWFGDTFSAAWEAIKKVFSSWGDFFGGLWDKIKTTFSKIGTNIGDAISTSVKAGINGVISTIEGTINTGIKLINGAIDLINLTPGVNIEKLDKLSLPRLWQGGVLEKGQVGLLEGDGAEAVVPLHNNKKWTSAVARDMDNALGGGSDEQANTEPLLVAIIAKLDELLEALLANQTITMNKREFARLVKEVG